MTDMPLAARIRESILAGPRRPEPFPDSGREVLLVTCPVCRTKNLPIFNAPYERGYPTKCLSCGVPAAVKPKDVSFGDIQRAGGFTPIPGGVRPRHVDLPKGDLSALEAFDASRHFEHLLAKHDYGSRRAQRRGLLPNVKTEKVRPLNRVT